MDEMRSKVECPVCMVVPRAGPVPMCPRGHFICSGCKEARAEAGRLDCPSCRGPMAGEAKSLLATVVIENVKHECEHKGCKEMVHYKQLGEHKEVCSYRLVRCPATDPALPDLCRGLIAFRDVEQHIKQPFQPAGRCFRN